jgi:NDP-sugar pyrophosphorylase family protein
MKIVLLLSGDNKPFLDAGFTYPKPLIEIHGKTILQYVIESIKPLINHGWELVAVLRKEDVQRFHLDKVVELLSPKSKIVAINSQTSGAACSVLLAGSHFQPEDRILIINGDQILNHPISETINKFISSKLDAGVITFPDVHPRWSFVKCDVNNMVVEAAEKRPISNNATAGIYYFSKYDDFFASCKKMIQKNANIDGNFYVCPIFNEMILSGKKIGVEQIQRNQYWPLSSPKDIQEFESHTS